MRCHFFYQTQFNLSLGCHLWDVVVIILPPLSQKFQINMRLSKLPSEDFMRKWSIKNKNHHAVLINSIKFNAWSLSISVFASSLLGCFKLYHELCKENIVHENSRRFRNIKLACNKSEFVFFSSLQLQLLYFHEKDHFMRSNIIFSLFPFLLARRSVPFSV